MLVLKGEHQGYFSLRVPCHIYLRSAWFLSCLQPRNPLLHFFSHLLSLLWWVVNKLPLTNSPTSPLTSCPTPLRTGSLWVHLAGGSAQEIIPNHKYVPVPQLFCFQVLHQQTLVVTLYSKTQFPKAEEASISNEAGPPTSQAQSAEVQTPLIAACLGVFLMPSGSIRFRAEILMTSGRALSWGRATGCSCWVSYQSQGFQNVFTEDTSWNFTWLYPKDSEDSSSLLPLHMVWVFIL